MLDRQQSIHTVRVQSRMQGQLSSDTFQLRVIIRVGVIHADKIRVISVTTAQLVSDIVLGFE